MLQALQFYRRVQELPEYNDKELWSKIAECHDSLGNQGDIVAMYEEIMQDNTFPAAVQHDAAVALTHLHLDAGDTLAAEQVHTTGALKRCCRAFRLAAAACKSRDCLHDLHSIALLSSRQACQELPTH